MQTSRPTSVTKDLQNQFHFFWFLDMDENHKHGPALDEKTEINQAGTPVDFSCREHKLYENTMFSGFLTDGHLANTTSEAKTMKHLRTP